MKVKDIINRVTTLYNDADYTRVTQKQYLEFLDDAINQLISLRPDTNVTVDTVKLEPGCRQTIPTSAYRLVDIYSNAKKNIDGTFSFTNPVSQIDRKDLDFYSNWRTATPARQVFEFMYDVKTPRQFFVYPPVAADADVYVEMAYTGPFSIQYSELTEDFDTVMAKEIPLLGQFKTALINYVLYLAYSTDSTSVNDKQAAALYEQAFYKNLASDFQATVTVAPVIAEAESPVQEGGNA